MGSTKVDRDSKTAAGPDVRKAPLRIGLLVDSPRSSKYAYDLAKWAQDRPGLDIACLIVHAPKTEASSASEGSVSKALRLVQSVGIARTFAQISASVMTRVITTIERFLLNRSERYREHFDDRDLSSIVPTAIAITPIVSKSGFVYRFAGDDVESLKALSLDLMVRCGGGILRGDILKAARFGIISFHHADNRTNRGTPAAFWEVYNREPTTGFTIQRLTEELDGGDVLMRGHVQTQYYYLLNQAALYEKSNYYMKAMIEKIAADRQMPEALPQYPYTQRLFRSPNAIQSAIYLTRLLGHLGRISFRRARGIDYRWSVSFVRSDWRNAVLWRGCEIGNAPYRFLADPFVVSRDDKDFCFVEEYDYRTGLGNISVYELAESAARRLGTVINEPFHLSFPFVFHYENELYMCPESAEARQIRLYKCREFPLHWSLEKVVMSDIAAVDSMFLPMHGKWWLFTNIDRSGDDDYFELTIFFADSPLSEQWTPHPQNPILVDSSRARNAGLVRDGDRFFRLAQSQGFDFYGQKALINEILALTETQYSEAIVSEISPGFGRHLIGSHHLHSNGRVTVFDSLRLSKISQ
jgi:hypothetical protein